MYVFYGNERQHVWNIGGTETKRTGNTVDGSSIESTRATSPRPFAAPTSSMNKAQPAGAHASPSNERGQNMVTKDRFATANKPKFTLGQITNGPAPSSRIRWPCASKIFSQPFRPMPQNLSPSFGSATATLILPFHPSRNSSWKETGPHLVVEGDCEVGLTVGGFGVPSSPEVKRGQADMFAQRPICCEAEMGRCRLRVRVLR